jgi:glycosyltransferase involved in cell wall biosynthesis
MGRSIAELRRRGHEVVTIAPKYPGYEDKDPRIIRLPSVPFPAYEGLRVAFPVLANSAPLKEFGPQIVHAHSPFTIGRAALSWARRKRIPMVYTCHSIYEDYLDYYRYVPRVGHAVTRRFLTDFCNQCDLVLAPSAAVRKKLADTGVRSRVEVLPTGAAMCFYDTQPEPDWRLRHGIPDRSLVMLYAGRLAAEKQVDLLLQALAATVRDGAMAPTHLVLAGKGPAEKELRKHAEDLGVAERVTFIGALAESEVAEVMHQVDGFAFASEHETQGLAILEAMAAGLPVVAVRAPAISEAVHDGITGFLVAPTPEAIAAKWGILGSDPLARRKMGMAGREAAMPLSTEAVGLRLEKLYAELLTNQ